MDLDAYFETELDEHEAVVRELRKNLREPFARLVAACANALGGGGKIMLFGNGGSASDAQHLAAELVVRYTADRPAMAAIALTTDSSVLTAGANDFGFETVFARQIEALGKPGDVAIGITTSGASVNVINGLEAAKAAGLVAAALSGRDGGKLPGLADPLLIVPSDTTARIQEMHIVLGHMLCDALERGAR
jgi:D-sedoheptulose 7-phosphate isomerase